MSQFFRNNDLAEWPLAENISVAGGSSGETMIFGTFFWNAQGSSQPAVTISHEEFGVTESVPDGYPRHFMRVLPASAPALSGSDRAFLEYQLIELGDWTFQGAYGIFSFWCKTPLAKEIVVRCIRDLGSGGQTITGISVFEIGRQSFQLTNGWKKYEVKFRFEELAGATYGDGSVIKLRIYLQGGSGELGGNGIGWVNSATDFASFSFTRQSEKPFEIARLFSSPTESQVFADVAARLIEITSAEGYELTAINYDSDGVITTATVKWPDETPGLFTVLVKNSSFLTIDSYSITHASTGVTITQPTVTRDSLGRVTVKPALVAT